MGVAMKMFFAIGLVLAVSACSQDAGNSVDIVISPLTRQLASCAAVARDRSDWGEGERSGRFLVNSRAAGRSLANDNPALSERGRAEIIADLVASQSRTQSSDYYESRCI